MSNLFLILQKKLDGLQSFLKPEINYNLLAEVAMKCPNNASIVYEIWKKPNGELRVLFKFNAIDGSVTQRIESQELVRLIADLNSVSHFLEGQ